MRSNFRDRTLARHTLASAPADGALVLTLGFVVTVSALAARGELGAAERVLGEARAGALLGERGTECVDLRRGLRVRRTPARGWTRAGGACRGHAGPGPPLRETASGRRPAGALSIRAGAPARALRGAADPTRISLDEYAPDDLSPAARAAARDLPGASRAEVATAWEEEAARLADFPAAFGWTELNAR